MSSKEPTTEPLVARDATYYRAPDSLRAKIRASIAADAREHKRPAIRDWGWNLGGMALAAAVAGALSWNVALMQARGGTDEEQIARDVEGAHIRSLMAAHFNDVASTDQHTVKPWFQGKLDFAPTVLEPENTGFTLLGGRLDYLNGRPVAAVTYRHRLHMVNLFEWPADDAADRAPALQAHHGYSTVSWKHRGLEYRMISDTAGADLLEFARKLAAS